MTGAGCVPGSAPSVRRRTGQETATTSLLYLVHPDLEEHRLSPASTRARLRSLVASGRTLAVPGATLAAEERAGASIVLYYGFSALVQFDALDRALATFKATRDANAVAGYRERVRAFEDFMGYGEFAGRARRDGAS